MTDIKTKKYHHGDLRQALLVAASQELETSGVEGFSLRKVAKRAGVSHAAPAHHFGDVNGLLTALAAEGYQRFISFMQDGSATHEDHTMGAGFGYIEFATKHPALFRLIFASDRPDFDNPVLCAAADAAFAHLCGLVELRTGQDPFTDGAAMEDALTLWAMAHGLADLMGTGRLKPLEALGPEQHKAMLTRVLARALPVGT